MARPVAFLLWGQAVGGCDSPLPDGSVRQLTVTAPGDGRNPAVVVDRERLNRVRPGTPIGVGRTLARAAALRGHQHEDMLPVAPIDKGRVGVVEAA